MYTSRKFIRFATFLRYLVVIWDAVKAWDWCRIEIENALFNEADYDNRSMHIKLLAKTYNLEPGQVNIWLEGVKNIQPSPSLASIIIAEICEENHWLEGPGRPAVLDQCVGQWIHTQVIKKKVVEAAQEISNTKGKQ